jgi:diguanylate cyclase (GGDEF)-like protein
VIVLHALAPVGTEFGSGLWAATFVAVGVGSVVAAGLVLLAIGLSDGAIPSRRLLGMMLADLLVSMTNTSVGLAVAIVFVHEPAAAVLLLPPAAILLVAYRAYLAERLKAETLDFLYHVVRSLSRATDIEAALVDLLERTRETFRAETVEIVLFASGAETPLRTSLGPGAGRELMVPVEAPAAAALRAAVQDEHATFTSRRRARRELARYLEQRGVEHALIAPVPGETRLTGVMLLGDRLGATNSLSDEDLRLFETLANHAGVSLEYDRLEQAMARMGELQQRLEHEAYSDALTGLANRARFLRALETSLTRPRGRATVLFLDLDGFKQINDVAGHAAGDAVLAAVAQRIDHCVRPDDVAARLGGDEFAVLLEDVDDAHAERVAWRLLELLGEPVAIDGGGAHVQASVGIASVPAGALDADELMHQADVAMYRAKDAGKGQVRFWCPELGAQGEGAPPSNAELRAAVAGGELTVHYQPIVALDGEDVVAMEALARWQHPTRGLLGPDAFLAAAEETRQIAEIDHIVLEHACRAAAGWDDERSVHVNLSGVELRSPEIVRTVASVLERTGLRPARLVLELPESALAGELPVIGALRDLGVGIALDDFGSGASSLALLRGVDVDVLKVGRPFLEGATRSRHERGLLRMVLELGALLGIRVVVEGIEREDQLTVLRELGCELGQGYLLGRPVEQVAPLAAAG